MTPAGTWADPRTPAPSRSGVPHASSPGLHLLPPPSIAPRGPPPLRARPRASFSRRLRPPWAEGCGREPRRDPRGGGRAGVWAAGRGRGGGRRARGLPARNSSLHAAGRRTRLPCPDGLAGQPARAPPPRRGHHRGAPRPAPPRARSPCECSSSLLSSSEAGWGPLLADLARLRDRIPDFSMTDGILGGRPPAGPARPLPGSPLGALQRRARLPLPLPLPASMGGTHPRARARGGGGLPPLRGPKVRGNSAAGVARGRGGGRETPGSGGGDPESEGGRVPESRARGKSRRPPSPSRRAAPPLSPRRDAAPRVGSAPFPVRARGAGGGRRDTRAKVARGGSAASASGHQLGLPPSHTMSLGCSGSGGGGGGGERESSSSLPPHHRPADPSACLHIWPEEARGGRPDVRAGGGKGQGGEGGRPGSPPPAGEKGSCLMPTTQIPLRARMGRGRGRVGGDSPCSPRPHSQQGAAYGKSPPHPHPSCSSSGRLRTTLCNLAPLHAAKISPLPPPPRTHTLSSPPPAACVRCRSTCALGLGVLSPWRGRSPPPQVGETQPHPARAAFDPRRTGDASRV